jgi:hypothetical protein
MRKSAPWFLLLMLLSVTTFAENAKVNNAQDKDALPNTYLRGKRMKFTHPGAHGAQKVPNAASLTPNVTTSSSPSCKPQSARLACADTITNFLGSFHEEGVYLDGATRDTWEYSMVGTLPRSNTTTVFNARVIPVTIDMLNNDGTPRSVVTNRTNCPHCTPSELGKTVRLISKPDSFVGPFLGSPVFANSTYNSSSVPTQITDAEMRAEFGNSAKPNWHTLLAPKLKAGVTMALVGGTYFYSLNDNGSCCAFVLVDISAFEDELFPTIGVPLDNSSLMGAAELSRTITTKDISTFLFPNVYLYFDFNVNECCVLGFHSIDIEAGDARNGDRLRFYVMNYSSWISPGLFADPTCATTDPENCLQDVTAHSHEVAEIFNDPFVAYDNIHNITPFWLNPAGQCQDIMEVGDVIEDLPNSTFPVDINGFTYHPQTEALLPWFEFRSPSTAINGAYSYPNETALTALSAPQPFNCAGK